MLECPVENITVFGADTDASPYDSGSYASSTTYVTGKAVENCALRLRQQILRLGAGILNCGEEEAVFDGSRVSRGEAVSGNIIWADGAQPDCAGGQLECDSAQPGSSAENIVSVSLAEIAAASMCGNKIALEAVETHSSPTSPPPYMAGAVEIDLDPDTGEVKVLDYAAAVDCGTPINPNLARVQAEGGILQGLGMALMENITYDSLGRVAENSLMQYKIPSRLDVGHIRVEFESSYEQDGPFGAKSIGEVVINTPLPAVADAIYNATGVRFYELPITPCQIVMETQRLKQVKAQLITR